MSLSLVMMTCNSEGYVERVLKQAAFYADERYVLVDANSTDDTLEICRANAEHVEVVHSAGYIEPHLPYLYDLPKTDWILRLDDDELLGEQFIQNYNGLMEQDVAAIWFPRYSMVPNFRYLADKPMYPDYQLRMFRKGQITPRTEIHLTPIIHGKSGTAEAHIFHMKFLWKKRVEREALAKKYETIMPGAGSGNYAAHQIPEDHYRGKTSFIDEWPVDTTKLVLNLGCGKRPKLFALNVDKVDVARHYGLSGQFVQHDLNNIPWPFEKADMIIMEDVLEHLKADSLDIFNELWRVMKPGGILRIRCPDASQPGVFKDMTHVKFFTYESFWHLDPDHLFGQEFDHYTPYKWKVLRADNLGDGNFIAWLQKRGGE